MDKKVSEYPLDVNIIEQTGFNQIELLYYTEDLELDDVSYALSLNQKFLNAYFELEGVAKIREDGYFDQKTEDYIFQFQQQQSLNLSKKLDKQTANKMYDLLKRYQNDLAYDNQLNVLVDLINA